MGASYSRSKAVFHCYNDCRQEGCPGHTIRLKSKHGGVAVEYLDAEGNVTSTTSLALDLWEAHAVAKLLVEGWK